ncbi:MAG: type III-B CRISPR module-associated protein Cmr5 [Verrucomicrobia bacterium]|nr:type III-B CRISPR module-associated protein Cmr5 [Verrucomicrobiota bacterium]
MTNLEQIRARNALARHRDVRPKTDEGDALSGYPSLIINNGLLATLAYSLQQEGKTNQQPFRIADALAYHLGNLAEGENLVAPKRATGEGLLSKLVESDSYHLQRCTTEALAFLSYLKRFAA